MRNILMASAAIVAFGFAAPAFAQEGSFIPGLDKNTQPTIGADLQVNAGGVQIAKTRLDDINTVGDTVKVSTTAIGNDLSVSNINTGLNVNAFGGELQKNDLEKQVATTKLDDVTVNTGLSTISTTAVGNAVSVSTLGTDSAGSAYAPSDVAVAGNIGLQKNDIDSQIAKTSVEGGRFGGYGAFGSVNVSTTAVGNDISVSGATTAFNLSGQFNREGEQIVKTSFENSPVATNGVFSTDAVGNISSVSAFNNAASLNGYQVQPSAVGFGVQINHIGAQVASTSIASSTFGSGLTVSTLAAGNVANVSVGH